MRLLPSLILILVPGVINLATTGCSSPCQRTTLRGSYDLEHVAEQLSEVEGSSVELARMRADLALISSARRDVGLARTIAESYGLERSDELGLSDVVPSVVS